MAQLLAFALKERLNIVVLQDGIDASIVEVGELDISIFSGSFATHELSQQTWCWMSEHIAIDDVIASLVALDDDLGYHE